MVNISREEYLAILERRKKAEAVRLGLTAETVARKALANPRRSKYGNVKVETPHGKFDSKAEYRHAVFLNAQADAGNITHLRKQVPFVLQEAFRDSEGNAIRAIKYVADFVYEQDGKKIVEDVKSPATRVKESYRIKVKMLKARYPDIVFREVFP